jgi:hypothetical protein
VTVRVSHYTIQITNSFHPHIVKEPIRRAEQLAWIEANGGAALLTLDLSVSFGRGEGVAARKVLMALESLLPKERIERTKAIHHQTLQKFCRDRIAAGLAVPDLLGVFNRQETILPPPTTGHKPMTVDTGLPSSALTGRAVPGNGYDDI